MSDQPAEAAPENEQTENEQPTSPQEMDAQPAADEATPATSSPDDQQHDALYDVTLELRAILGSAHMEVSNLLKLGRGAIIELDQKVKADVTLFAAGKLIAYGQVVVVNDKIAVKISRLARPDAH